MTLLNYSTLSCDIDATQLRTEVIGSAPVAHQTITEYFDSSWQRSDGAAGDFEPPSIWLLSFPVSQSPDVPPSLLVNGVDTPVQVGAPTGDCPFYGIIQVAPGIYALTTGTAPPPTNQFPPDTLALTYEYDYDAVIGLRDNDAVALYSGVVGNRGVFTVNSGSGSGLSLAQALTEARVQLTDYSSPILKATVTIGEFYQGTGIETGQRFSFTSNRLGLHNITLTAMKVDLEGGTGPDTKRTTLELDG